MMSGDSNSRSFSESLVLDDTEKGVVITGITDDRIAAETGLQAGDEIVAATIHLDHLNKHEVMNILKVLEPYDNNMKVLTKKELTSADRGSLGFGLKEPIEILNLKKDLSLDASTEAPVVSLDQSRELNTVQGLGGEISGPTLNGDLPSLSLKTPLGLSGPNIKGDLGGTVKAPEVSVATPQVITPSSSLDIKKPEMKTGSLKYKPPVFKMPNFNQSASDLKPPDLDLNDPDVNLNADISAPSGKIQWPHLKWKGPKVKRPDADLTSPEASLSSPRISGDFSTPDVDCNIPKTDIKGSDLHIQTPNLNSDASSKINWPHFKWMKPKPTGPKADLDLDSNLNKPDADLTFPKVEGGINGLDAEIHLPNADIKGPNLEMKKTNTEVVAPSGNIQWPHLKWKKPKGPKSDLNLPNQEIDGDIKVHNTELNLPKADLNCPDVDVQAPDCDIDASSDKHWPHLKWKKNKIHRPKTDAKLNADLSTPDVDLSVPKIDSEISTDADIEAPSGKFRMPTLKKPKFLLSGAKVKSPEVDLDAEKKIPDLSLSPEASLDGPDVDLNLTKPEVKLTNVDSGLPSERFKWPTLKKPKWSASGPKAESPGVDLDADVSALDLSPSAPKTDIEISAKDANLNLPDGPIIETDTPDVAGKLKWFNFKIPKHSTLKGRKDEIDADVKVPDVDLKGPDVNLSAPDVNLSGGVIEAPDSQGLSVSIPNADVDYSGPDLDLDSSHGKLNLPQIKQPKLNIDVNPNVDLKAKDLSLSAPQIESWNAPAPDINLPSIDLKNTDVDLKAPEADVLASIGEGPSGHPSVESGIEVPKVNIRTPIEDGNISVPAADLGVPKAEGDVKGPDVDVKAPNVDANLEKSKMPHFKLPKLDFLGSNIKAPKVDASKNLEVSPDLIKTPSADGEFSSPHLSASAPEVKTSLSTPELDITAEADAEVKGAQKRKMRWPFKFGLKSGSGTDEEGSGVDSETDVSNTEVEVPAFKFHKLPRNSFDGIGGISDTLGLSKLDTEEKDYIVSKGIRLPIVNATSKMGENINIMERLKMAKDKATNVSPTEAKTDAPEKSESGLGRIAHGISSSDENDKLSLGLSNMLGLNIKDSDAD